MEYHYDGKTVRVRCDHNRFEINVNGALLMAYDVEARRHTKPHCDCVFVFSDNEKKKFVALMIEAGAHDPEEVKVKMEESEAELKECLCACAGGPTALLKAFVPSSAVLNYLQSKPASYEEFKRKGIYLFSRAIRVTFENGRLRVIVVVVGTTKEYSINYKNVCH